MGTFAQGWISIELNHSEESTIIHDLINTDEKFNITEDTYNKDDVYPALEFELSSEREQNLEYQIEELISLLKTLIKNEKISAVLSFSADVMVAGDSISLDEDDFVNP